MTISNTKTKLLTSLKTKLHIGANLKQIAKLFNGDGYISFTNIFEYNLSNSDFEIEIYFKILSTPNANFTLMSNYVSSTDKRSYAITYYTTKTIRFSCSGNGESFSKAEVLFDLSVVENQNRWIKLNIKKIGSSSHVVIDNSIKSLDVEESLPISLYDTDNLLVFGVLSDLTTYPFSGAIYNPKIYKHRGNIDLFLQFGQSNQKGNETNPELFATELQKNQQHLFSYSLNNSDVTSYSEDYLPLKPQYYCGCELQFGHLVTQNKKKPIAILKVADGGTGFGEGQWVKGGSCYNEAISKYQTFVSEMENKGYTVNTKALLWMQGENDTRSEAWANAYSANFQQFYADVLSDLSLPSGFPVIMGKIHDDLPTGGDGGRFDYSEIVRAQQELLGQLSYITLINTDNLDLMVDSTHYNYQGLTDLGTLYYNACNSLGLFTSNPTKTPVIDVRFDKTDVANDVSVNNNDGTIINGETVQY